MKKILSMMFLLAIFSVVSLTHCVAPMTRKGIHTHPVGATHIKEVTATVKTKKRIFWLSWLAPVFPLPPFWFHLIQEKVPGVVTAYGGEGDTKGRYTRIQSIVMYKALEGMSEADYLLGPMFTEKCSKIKFGGYAVVLTWFIKECTVTVTGMAAKRSYNKPNMNEMK